MAAETVGQPAELPNRLERRKQRTRAALIQAAQVFIGAGKLNAPILEITQAADVGMGSFYNYFDSKEELFAAALNEVLDAHGALLDEVTESLDDPAETFACSFRLTGRLFRRRPQESRVLLATGVFADVGRSGSCPEGAARYRRGYSRQKISHRRSHIGARPRRGCVDGIGSIVGRRTGSR